MLSSQRFIWFIVMFNLIMGMASTMETHEDTYDAGIVTNITEQMIDQDIDSKSDTGIYGTTRSTANRQYEGTIGNAITWGGSIINVMIRMVNPLSVNRGLTDNSIYYPIIDLIILFRVMLATIGGLEVYFIFKNRKVT